MEDAPLPTTMTPKEIISEFFEIKQDENNYKLNIQIINQDIILNLSDQAELIKEYENKLTLEELKRMHRIFLPLNSCQEFVDYLKALIDNKKFVIKNNAGNRMLIELEVEYLFKKNIIKIDLFQKKINFELIAQDLYKKFSSLTENFKYLENNYQNLVKENNKIKEENKNIIEENKNIKEEIENLKVGIEILNEKNKKIIEENINIKNDIKKLMEANQNDNKKIDNLDKAFADLIKGNIFKYKDEKNEIILDGKNNNLINIKIINELIEKIVGQKLKTFEDKIYHLLGKKLPLEKKDKNFVLNEKNLVELFYDKLLKIFYDTNPKIETKDINEFKKISLALIIKGKDLRILFEEILENTFNKNFEKLDEIKKVLMGKKKGVIYLCLDDLEEIRLNKIDKKK